jgi:hypothetical protein
VRWHGRLKTEAPLLMRRSGNSRAALASLCAGEGGSIELLAGAADTSSASVRARSQVDAAELRWAARPIALAAAVLHAWWSRRPGRRWCIEQHKRDGI